jgi:molybdate transport system substrate-binding protein
VLCLAAVLLTACGSAPASGKDSLSGELTVFAAASTTDVFEQLATAFEADHPQVTVRLSFAGSQQLASQLLAGAPVDVYASANPTQMDRVVDAGLIAGEPEVFTANAMALAVEPGNPKSISGLSELAAEELTVVLAAEEVPAGGYARQVLDRAGVQLTPDSSEPDVRQALNKVAVGEADAAIVYRSDVVTADDRVAEVGLDDEVNVAATYPIAVRKDAPNPGAARAFVAFVNSAEGQQVLAEYGFAQP